MQAHQDCRAGGTTMFELGPAFHTFSISARCPRTGRLGIAIATRAVAVASRCVHVAPNVGAVASQASTDPRLGILGLHLLRMGYSAPKVLQELAASDPHIEYRQLAVVDRDGRSAAHTGAKNLGWAGHVVKQDFVAMGNALVGGHVVEAMAHAFEASQAEDLEQRLLRSIEAGRDAGGQPGGQRSAGLLVYDHEVFSRVDLRVDEHPEPIRELRRIFDLHLPSIEYYMLRPTDPTIPAEGEWLTKQRGGQRS
ncbi:MAG: DUF1028 domain-containing protein [Chloroflexi bacterium]|nr:DUF1028 domain-containing protein [Chloroflexota bacterium]